MLQRKSLIGLSMNFETRSERHWRLSKVEDVYWKLWAQQPSKHVDKMYWKFEIISKSLHVDVSQLSLGYASNIAGWAHNHLTFCGLDLKVVACVFPLRRMS